MGFYWAFSSHSARRGHIDEEVFGSVYDQRVVVRLLPYIAPFKLLTFVATVAMLIYTATQVAGPWIIKIAIDDYILPGDFVGLRWIFGIFVAIAVVNWIMNYVQQYAMERVGQGVLYNLRRQVFGHVQKQSVSFYDKTEVGRMMSRVQGDVGQLQEFSSLVVMTLGELLSLIGIVVALLLMDWKLGLISMVVLPVLTGIMAVWQPLARKAFIEVRRTISIVNGELNQNITGVRVVQAMNRQERNLEEFDAQNVDHREANLHAARLSSVLLPAVDILTAIAIGLAIYFGARMVSSGSLTDPGVLAAFILYIQRFFDPIRHLTMMYTQLQKSMASGSRIFDLLDWEPDLVDAPNATRLKEIRGEIEFQDVSFSYVPGEDVISNVSLQVEPGRGCCDSRSHRRGKNNTCEPDVAILRRRAQQRSGARGRSRRPRCCTKHARAADEHGASGALPVLRHGEGKHQVQPHRGDRRPNGGSRESGRSPRFHRGAQ